MQKFPLLTDKIFEHPSSLRIVPPTQVSPGLVRHFALGGSTLVDTGGLTGAESLAAGKSPVHSLIVQQGSRLIPLSPLLVLQIICNPAAEKTRLGGVQ